MKRKFGLPSLTASGKASSSTPAQPQSSWQRSDSPKSASPPLPSNSGSDLISRPPPLDSQAEEELRRACAVILKDLKPSGHDLEDTRMKTDILLEGDEHDYSMASNLYPLRSNPHSATDWAVASNRLQKPSNPAKYSSTRGNQSVRVPRTIMDVPQDVEEQAHETAESAEMASSQSPPKEQSRDPLLAPAPSVATNLRREYARYWRPLRRDEQQRARDSSELSSAAPSTTSTNLPMSTSTGLSSTAFTPGSMSQLVTEPKTSNVSAPIESPTVDVVSSQNTSASHPWQITAHSSSSTTSLPLAEMGSNLQAQAVPIIRSRPTSLVPSPAISGLPTSPGDPVSRSTSRGATSPLSTQYSYFAEIRALRRATSQPALLQSEGEPSSNLATPPIAPPTSRLNPRSGRLGPPNQLNSRQLHLHHEEAEEERPETLNLASTSRNARRHSEMRPIEDLELLDIRDKSDEPLATSRARIASRHNSRNLSMLIPDRPQSMSFLEAQSPARHSESTPQSATRADNDLGGRPPLPHTDPEPVSPMEGPVPSTLIEESQPQVAIGDSARVRPSLGAGEGLRDDNIIVRDFWQPLPGTTNLTDATQSQNRQLPRLVTSNTPSALPSRTPTLAFPSSADTPQSPPLLRPHDFNNPPQYIPINATRSLTLSTSRPPNIYPARGGSLNSASYDPHHQSRNNSYPSENNEYIRRPGANVPLSQNPNFHLPRVASNPSFSPQSPSFSPSRPSFTNRPPQMYAQGMSSIREEPGSSSVGHEPENEYAPVVKSYPVITAQAGGKPLQMRAPNNQAIVQPINQPTNRKSSSGKGLKGLFLRFGSGGGKSSQRRGKNEVWTAPRTAEEMADEEYYGEDDDGACEAPVIRLGPSRR